MLNLNRIRISLIITNALVLLFILIAIVFSVYVGTKISLEKAIDNELLDVTHQAKRYISTLPTLSFTILQTSQSNEVLSYIHELDIDESTGRLAITLKDLSGKSVFSSEQAYITGYPTVA